MLGVNPATLRQWTTLGKLHAYRTPGGHRRFSASEIASLAEAEEPPAIGTVAAVLEQLRQRYRTVAHSIMSHEPRLSDLTAEARQQFHSLGDTLLTRLGDYLTAATAGERRAALAEARSLGAGYSKRCAASGLDTARVVEAYVLFRRPVLDVLSKALVAHPRQGPELSRIMRDAERFMDEVLASVANASGDRVVPGPPPGREDSPGDHSPNQALSPGNPFPGLPASRSSPPAPQDNRTGGQST
ncbi:MAG: MerR family transcriptional regulator [Chloroflexi bacterium]|nr:MerR family transcriptional regulator [Chloroflexota bacterium]